MTEGYTGADIAGLVNAAALSAIKEHLSGGNSKTAKLMVSIKHFEAAAQKIKRTRNASIENLTIA